MSVSTPSRALTRPRPRRRSAVALALFVAILVLGSNPGDLSAHTGFESSTPADGAAVDEAVSVVTIVFTGEATPVGDEFVALTPAGVLQMPVSVETVDSKVFSIRFEPPLAGGQVGLRWNVQAADAHPIEGAFSFTVNASAPTTTPPTTPQTAPQTTTSPAAVPATTIESATTVASQSGASPSTSVDPVRAGQAADDEQQAAASDGNGSPDAAGLPAAPSLEEFLTVDDSSPGANTATVGRLIGFLAVALGLGAFAFVATTLRGRREEIRHALTAVRILGVVVAVGAAIEYVGVTRMGGEPLTSGWTTAPGFATVLRIVGGVGLAVGVAGTLTRIHPAQRPPAARPLSAAVVDDRRDQASGGSAGRTIASVRWIPDARSWPAFGGTLLIIASFWFDGHTVSKGFRPGHALVNSVHVAAGAIWAGGVVTMAAIIWTRYRAHEPMRVVELVVRFSKIATIALGTVVVAGGIMAVLVLDSFGELTSTSWGKILLLKTAAVGLAILGGAYNHFRLLPALESDPESPELLAELRSTVIAEATMLVFVVSVTAWLVAAAS